MNAITSRIQQISQNAARHNTASYAAAIAYHTIISLGPLLLLSITIASRTVGQDTAIKEFTSTLERYVGPALATVIHDLMLQLRQPTTDNLVVAILAALITIYAATNVFRQLVIALNVVWDVQPPNTTIKQGFFTWAISRLRNYIIGLLMAFSVILALLASLAVSVITGYFTSLVHALIPGLATLLTLFNFSVLPIILVLVAAVLFKFLPDIDVAWRDVWLGALLTGIVLAVGEGLIGLYASQSRIPSFYGVAGSVVVLMLWAYVSAYILLIGAEFTRVHSKCR